VGANGAYQFPNHNLGAAYIFVEPATGWADMTETAELKFPDNQPNEGNFGNAVATDGTTVAVGWTAPISKGGIVFIFVEPSTGWKTGLKHQAILESGRGFNGGFGDALAFGQGILVVGAPFGSPTIVNDPGAAYVFVEPKSGWRSTREPTAELTASDAHKNDWFGYSVSISGDTIAVGAAQSQWAGRAGPGAVYVYVKPTGQWRNMTETAELRASDGQNGDQLGASVAFNGSGETLWVGAPGRNSGQGAAYVYVMPNTGWHTTSAFNTEIASPELPGFGAALSVSGDAEAITDDTDAYIFGPE
jgi:hypothetical protein